MTDHDPWSDLSLDQRRGEGDPPADAVLDAIFAAGDGVVYSINLLMRSLVDNDDLPAAGLPPALRDYFVRGAALPDWADREAIALASQVFHTYAPQIILLLHTAALPTCYACRRGVQVLARSGRMYSDVQRRVIETAQFVIDVMAPGGLDRDPNAFGAGIRSAQKVRLMHAAIRRHLRRDPTWDPAWGTPINQEDLAGTLLSFSWIILRGLERLGVELSPDERAAYLHTWCVVGHLLGLDPTLLTHDLRGAERLTGEILRRNQGVCPEGQLMTRALIDAMERTIPGTSLDGLPTLLIHDSVGAETAALLGVPAPQASERWIGALRSAGAELGDERRDHALVRAGAPIVGRLLLRGLMLAYRGPGRAAFNIPRTLRAAHDLS